MTNHSIRIMVIVAHQDDAEFHVAGTLALLRRHYGEQLALKLITTSRGAAGHHEKSLEETFARRIAEQKCSAALLDMEYECLVQLDGTHVAAQVFIDRNLLGGLWNAIRAFEPDYIFCPPVCDDPLAGVHIDHLHTALAVRLVAYQLCVPHAYPSISGKAKLRVSNPLVINMDDI